MSHRTDDLMHAICPECHVYDGHPLLADTLAGCEACGAIFDELEAVVC